MAAFDKVCTAQEEQGTLNNCVAMRKTAQGILIELEGSRQHYHQRIAKSHWERAVESALQTGVRQLKDLEDESDESYIANLTREAELLKCHAEREASSAILEQDKMAEATTVQILLEAHFETISLVNRLLGLDEAEAVDAAKSILNKIMTACLDATNYTVQPDSRAPVDESFPPSQTGTPKRRKQNHHVGPSPLMRGGGHGIMIASHHSASPMRPSPRKRKVVLAKKSVTFTPKKKTPSKRRVQWKDDVENGQLAEYAKTPQRLDSTPITAPPEALSDTDAAAQARATGHMDSPTPVGSSPLPAPPVPSLDIRTKNSRFATGFLSKKADSPPSKPPTLSALPASDSEQSPLRDLKPSEASNRSPVQPAESLTADMTTTNENGNNSSSDNEQSTWKVNRSEAMQIKSAMKRVSSAAYSSSGSGSGTRPQRRRSPGGASSSPPGDMALFTASHARRMVRGDKENAMHNVLSPRTAPITKNGRRTTIGDGRQNSGLSGREAVRLSALANNGNPGGARVRESSGATLGAKGVWR